MWLPGGLNPSSKYDEFTEGPELVLWMTGGMRNAVDRWVQHSPRGVLLCSA